MEEIEVKYTHVNVEDLKTKLEKLGAVFVGRFEYKRKSYDYTDKRLADIHAWVRLRDEGNKIVLTYKQRFGHEGDTLREGGMKEVEVEVSDFAKADELLKSIGLVEKFYEENIRERYTLGHVEIDIDSWPLIPPYVEIEGASWDEVRNVSDSLGFDWDKHLRCSTMQIYEMEGIDENAYSILTFDQQIKK